MFNSETASTQFLDWISGLCETTGSTSIMLRKYPSDFFHPDSSTPRLQYYSKVNPMLARSGDKLRSNSKSGSWVAITRILIPVYSRIAAKYCCFLVFLVSAMPSVSVFNIQALFKNVQLNGSLARFNFRILFLLSMSMISSKANLRSKMSLQ